MARLFKKGLFTGLAADYCGIVLFADLEVPNSVIEREANQESLLQTVTLAKRPRSAHKGLFGHVLVVGGDYGYAGAAKLAAEAALNCGAGLVTEVSQFLFKETLGNANFRKILALSNVSF
ncbi:NAD(P)H-hydrate epimerase (EC / ADP-dependent (S)-NAD(P)H-hydrate dehydratase (EC [uncultured Gammaproteobacteria bacterium]|nr:NAD(P)H-hydrate epimerase (EC / ADP-dependent (S)-NAD(P)H-hydrate dehydratase (EC [uncultured Gammaproteobacteria bacterium]